MLAQAIWRAWPRTDCSARRSSSAWRACACWRARRSRADSLQLLLEVNRAQLPPAESRLRGRCLAAAAGTQIGLTGPAEAAPVDSLPPPALPFTDAHAIAEMRRTRTGGRGRARRERSADARGDVGARSDTCPDVHAGRNVRCVRRPSCFPIAFKRTQLAVTVSFPVWDGGQRELALARANAERDVARADRDERERSSNEAHGGGHPRL